MSAVTTSANAGVAASTVVTNAVVGISSAIIIITTSNSEWSYTFIKSYLDLSQNVTKLLRKDIISLIFGNAMTMKATVALLATLLLIVIGLTTLEQHQAKAQITPTVNPTQLFKGKGSG